MRFDAVDAFAGPGGWDVAADRLGLRVLGIELDDAACATRRAAGHSTLQADVAELNPADHPAEGLIGSPPCPTFSSAGNGNGRLLIQIILDCARDLAAGHDTRGEARAAAAALLSATEERDRAERDAAMSLLVVEPLRWAMVNRSAWIALEQVPPVLAIWQAFAAILREHGWHVWTGVLEAERYGVPQTRERAILLARRDRQPHPPAATHQRYVPGEPQRHDFTLEGEVLPWVSMAEALGWGMTERPGLMFAPGTGNGGAAYEGGSGARKVLHGARDRGAWAIERPSTNVNCDPRISAPGRDDPAQSGSQQEGAIRVTPQEAAILQSFPADYPWQGSRSKVFQQIGNAVPPLLAEAILASLLGLPRSEHGQIEQTGGARATHWDRRAAPSAGVHPRPVTEPAPTILAEGLRKGRDVWRDENAA